MEFGASNKAHPELRPGEVFFSNIASGRPCKDKLDNRSGGWEGIGWKTKRLGNVAYDINGNPVVGCRPVFVQRAELQKAGVDPDE